MPAVALAGPVGEQVAAGTATVSRPDAATTLVNQQSQKAVIDWQRFSIAAREQVRFQQPGADSVALNRVIGTDPSAIYGRLIANGQIFLVNPSGVLFGPGSQVSVQGLLATTHDIGNADFMAGRYTFAGQPYPLSDAAVINQGNLTAGEGGYIVLAGDYAANVGVIQARLGQVALASGSRFTLDIDGDQLISLAVDEASLAHLAGVENLGTITADGGRVVMTAKVADNLASTVVNNEGLIQARSIEERNGEIVLAGGATGAVSNGGIIDAAGFDSGETGGRVVMLGREVGLLGSAVVEVSGASGGGTALIGGGYQGQNPLVQNSFATILDKNAMIKADATQAGDGGKVIVWADGSLTVRGAISARGGMQRGNGGFVETSGAHVSIAAGSRVDTSAPFGLSGVWFIDPDGYVIAPSDGDIDGITLGNNLETTDVTISSTEGGGLALNPGEIWVNDTVSWTSNHRLTLNATNDILIGNDILGGNGGLTLNAGPGGVSQDSFTTVAVDSLKVVSGGSVYLNSSLNQVHTLAAEVTNAGESFVFFNADGFTVGNVDGLAGITTNDGDIVLNASGSNPLQVGENVNAGAGDITIDGMGGIDVAADKAVYGADVSLSSSDASGNVTINGSVTCTDTVSVNAGGDIAVGSGGSVSGAFVSLIANDASGNVTIDGTVNGFVEVVFGGLGMPIAGSGTVSAGTPDWGEIYFYSNGDVVVGSGGLIDPAKLGGPGSGKQFMASAFDIWAGTDSTLTVNDPINLPASSLFLGGGTIALNADVSTGSSVSFGGASAIVLNADVSTAGSVSFYDLVSLSGSGTVSAGTTTDWGEIYFYSNGDVVVGSGGIIDPAKLGGPGSGKQFMADAFGITAGITDSTLTVNDPINLPASSLSLDGGTIVLNADVSTGSSVSFGGPSAIVLNADVSTTGSVSFYGLGSFSGSGTVSAGTPNGGEIFFYSSGDVVVGSGGLIDPAKLGGPGSGKQFMADAFDITAEFLLTVNDPINLPASSLSLSGESIVLNADVSAEPSVSFNLRWSDYVAYPDQTDIKEPFAIVLNADVSTAGSVYFNNPVVSFSGSGTVSAGTTAWGGIYFYSNGDVVVGSGGFIDPAKLGGPGSGKQFMADAFGITAGADSALTVNDPINLPASGLYLEGGAVVVNADVSVGGGNCIDAVSTSGDFSQAAGTTLSTTGGGGISVTSAGNISAGTGIIAMSDSGDIAYQAAGSTTVDSSQLSTSGMVTVTGEYTSVSVDSGGGTVATAPIEDETPPPSLDACIADPSAAGCSAVLPSVDACVANPSAAGCSAVLPSIDACVTNPSAAGCSAVLPSMGACVTNPGAAGCSAVLPSMGACVTNPGAAGCSAVLPSLDACVTNPSGAGCSAVLPQTVVEETTQTVTATVTAVTSSSANSSAGAPQNVSASESETSATDSAEEGNNKKKEEQAGKAGLTEESRQNSLAAQPIFDLSGGGVAGQSLVCK